MFAKLVLGISVTHASSTLLLLVLCVADGVCHLRVYGYKHADMLVDCRHTSCSQCTFAVCFFDASATRSLLSCTCVCVEHCLASLLCGHSLPDLYQCSSKRGVRESGRC